MKLRFATLLLVALTNSNLTVRPHAAAFLIAAQAPTVTPDPGPNKTACHRPNSNHRE
jgi:hypothetical protein